MIGHQKNVDAPQQSQLLSSLEWIESVEVNSGEFTARTETVVPGAAPVFSLSVHLNVRLSEKVTAHDSSVISCSSEGSAAVCSSLSLCEKNSHQLRIKATSPALHVDDWSRPWQENTARSLTGISASLHTNEEQYASLEIIVFYCFSWIKMSLFFGTYHLRWKVSYKTGNNTANGEGDSLNNHTFSAEINSKHRHSATQCAGNNTNGATTTLLSLKKLKMHFTHLPQKKITPKFHNK